MATQLVLFTTGFPYGSFETFLETEITYLAEAFDEVIIVAINPDNNMQRKIPLNCTVISIEVKLSLIGKGLALFYFFHPMFWQEVEIIKKIYQKKLSFGIVSTILISLFRANKIKKQIESIVSNAHLSTKIFFYSYWCDDSALALALIQDKFPDVTTFSRIHGWDVFFEVSKVGYLPFRHYIADNLTAIFSISEKGKNYCKDVWKINSPSKIKVSRLGVSSQSQVKFSEEFILVSCSNLIPLKRVDLIIHALSKLKNFNIRWVHFGDGLEMEHLEETAKKHLTKNIQCEFKGRVANIEVLKWYAYHHPSLFINVSSSEGVPVSIMEAMSFGIPVIATNVGGNSEIVNELNGYLISSDPTNEDIVQSIKRHFQLPIEIRELKGKEAKNTWNKLYNADANYNSLCDEILKLKNQDPFPYRGEK